MIATEPFEKLIITVTTANSWIHPEVKNWALNDADLINDAIECYEAGASIVHIHLPRDFIRAKSIVEGIRDQCDIIIQAGMSSFPIGQRESDFSANPDMLSIIANHHAEHFTEVSVDALHPLQELEQYCVKCKTTAIKPEWEIWHMGSYWNLNYLIERNILESPHVLTLFFNWPGGTWSPATPDEFFHRLRYIPPNSKYTISTMGTEHSKMVALAITHGGNVRVGTEDFPFLPTGVPAKKNAEIVMHTTGLAKECGRELADPSEARRILKIPLK